MEDLNFDFDTIIDEIEIEYNKCELEYKEYEAYLKNRQIVPYINNIILYNYINTMNFVFFYILNNN
jgi:hypothetical protein